VIAYLECSTGVSGDKLLGALIGAGFDPEILREALASAGLGRVTVDVSCDSCGAIGLSVAEESPPRRSPADIRAAFERAAIPEPARMDALRVLEALVHAEATVHGVPPEQVHLHEIGASDTIVDVLGVVLGLHTLGIEELNRLARRARQRHRQDRARPAARPAPATARLLEGVPVEPGRVGGELTTPTGAALVATLAASFGALPAMTLRRIGTGRGTREHRPPQRVPVFPRRTAAEAADDVVVLETNLDHLTAEEIAVAAERLLQAGALDVWLTPIVMKKGRPATLLSVLAPFGDAGDFAGRIIAETGTLGVRMLPAERHTVPRDIAEIGTPLGTARFKTAHLPDGTRALRVESDDAVRLSELHGTPVDVMARKLETEASRVTGIQPMRQRPSSADTNPRPEALRAPRRPAPARSPRPPRARRRHVRPDPPRRVQRAADRAAGGSSPRSATDACGERFAERGSRGSPSGASRSP
jgi:uncharacterized protein (TIGR00299 family) protein